MRSWFPSIYSAIKGDYALGRDNSLVTTELEFTFTIDTLVEGENIFSDSFQFLALQKGGFVKLVLDLEPRQRAKE